MSTATRPRQPAAEAEALAPPPAPPSIPKPPQAPEAPPMWQPAPLACREYSQHHVGADLRRYLQLSFDNDTVLPSDMPTRTLKAAEVRAQLEQVIRQELARDLRPLIDREADAALAAKVRQLEKEAAGTDILTEEWELRLRRLETEEAPAQEIELAKEQFVAADEKLDRLKAELARLRDEATGTTARRRREAAAIAARVAAETVKQLQEERGRLLQDIASRCGEQFTRLVAAEMKLAGCADLERKAISWVDEILAPPAAAAANGGKQKP